MIESIKKEQMDAAYMSERLKDDDNVIKTAIDCNSHNLRHASERLKDNKDFVLYAIHKSGHTYQFISPRLKEDRGILLEAFKNYEFLMDKLPKHLQEEIGENDPVEYLESYLLKEKFKDSLEETVNDKKKTVPLRKKL